MRNRFISESVSAGIMGFLYALLYNGSKVKWSRLGRAAYLQDKANFFDKYIASPAPAIRDVVLFVIFALGLFLLYKALEFAIFKALSPIMKGRGEEG